MDGSPVSAELILPVSIALVIDRGEFHYEFRTTARSRIELDRPSMHFTYSAAGRKADTEPGELIFLVETPE